MVKNEDAKSTQINVPIDRPIRVLHFSDGIEEEMEESKVTELNTVPRTEETIDTKILSWGPWFSHYVWKSGSRVLDTVDYVGETLADFFGITTPKYQLEISEYERLQQEKQKLEAESVGWVPNNSGGDIPLVMNEPSKDINKTGIVE